MSSKIMVSICMITYNHEKYIRDAIEGVLKQQVNFNIELLIGEDFSTDYTRQICEEYFKNNSQIIKLLPAYKNIGGVPNFIRTLEACSGKYIAICEGDDYWTDPLKLQKQVGFLEANPDFAICFHDARKLFQETGDDNTRFFENKKPKSVTFLHDIINSNYIPTLTCVYRNKLFSAFPPWYKDAFPGDWPLHILNAQYGKIKYIDEVMAVYRIHSGGSVSMGNNPISTYEKYVKTFEQINKWDGITPKNMFRRTLLTLYYELAVFYLAEKNFNKAKTTLFHYFKLSRYINKQTLKAIVLLYKIYLKNIK